MSEVKTVETTGGDAQGLTTPTHPDASVRTLAAVLLRLAGYLPTPPDWYETAMAKQYNAVMPWLPVDFTPIRRPVNELQYGGARAILYAFKSCATECIAKIKHRDVALPADVVGLGDSLIKRLQAIDDFATNWLLRISEDSWDTDKTDFLAEASHALVEAGPPYELANAYRRLRHRTDDCIHAISPLPEETVQAADSETADATKELDNGKKPVASETQTRGKRRKGRQQRTDAELKIIAFITQHHNYASDCPLNMTPIGVRELARQLGVSESTVSGFFKKEFGCYEAYERMCKSGNQQVLLASLKVLNDEFTPRILVEKPNEIAQPARPNDDEQSDVDANL